MKLDPTCPVEIREWEILRDDRAHARAYLSAVSCTQSAPVHLEGSVRWIDAQTGNYIENTFSMQPSGIGPNEPFRIPVSASFAPMNVRLMVYFTRAVFADGSEWTGSAETLRHYPNPPVLPGHLANRLASAAGRDAVCCAQEMENGDWLCVCGRWNDRAEERCMRCGREKAETLARFDPESVETLMPDLGPIDIEMPMTDRAEEYAAQPEPPHASPIRRILIAVLLAAVFACMALGIRALRYEQHGSSGLMPTSNAAEQIDL